MKKNANLLPVISGILLLFALILIFMEHRRRVRTFTDAMAADAENLGNDWNQVGSSIRKGTETYRRETVPA